MATQDELNLLQQSQLPPDLLAAQQQLNRQQQYANLLMQQGQQQPQGQMVSGYYVKPSFFQQLAPVAQMLTGAYLAKQGDTKATELAKALREGRSAAEEKIIQQMTGTPAQATELAGPYAGNIPMPTAVKPAVAPDLSGALRAIRTNEFGAGKEFTPAILKQMMPEPTTLEREYKAAQSQGYKGTINDFKNQMNEADKARIALDQQRLGLEGARFGLEQQKFAQELSGTKLTETQGNATGFGVRAKQANEIATNLENKGVTIPGKTSTIVSGIAGMTPFVGDKYAEATKSAFNVLPEFAGGLSPEQQQNAQARKNFVSAVLRKESGAAISPTEYANEERKYFPQLGDSEAVIKQKQEARESAIKALELQAGPGAKFIKESSAAPSTDGWSVKSVK